VVLSTSVKGASSSNIHLLHHAAHAHMWFMRVTDQPSRKPWLKTVTDTHANMCSRSTRLVIAYDYALACSLQGYPTIDLRASVAVDSLFAVGAQSGGETTFKCPDNTVVTGIAGGSHPNYVSRLCKDQPWSLIAPHTLCSDHATCSTFRQQLQVFGVAALSTLIRLCAGHSGAVAAFRGLE
jgi:hypothetical protein